MIARTLILTSLLTLGTVALPAQAETSFHFSTGRASLSVRDHHDHKQHQQRGHRAEYKHRHGKHHHYHRHYRHGGHAHHGRR